MPQPDVDYSLYLVTDSTPAILGDRDLVDVVRNAVSGGKQLLTALYGALLFIFV